MRRKYQLIWASPARIDLVEIAEFIADDNPVAARTTIKKIKEQVSNLHFQPEQGRIVPELASQGIVKYRELIVSPWRILYQIDKTKVYIVLVVDGRRDLEDILFKRIMR